MGFFKRFFSTEKAATKLERELQRAVATPGQPRAFALFCRALSLRLEQQSAQHLADIILTYGPQIAAMPPLEAQIPADQIRQALSLLEEAQHDSAAILLYDYAGYAAGAIDLLARRGQANELIMRVAHGDNVDGAALDLAVRAWETHNNDIRRSPTMAAMLVNIAAVAPECIPDNPRVREIIGQYQAAADAYAAQGSLVDAAHCYEQADDHLAAYKIYEAIGDREGASRAAEAMGDLETALERALSPARRITLLIRLGRLAEARTCAVGMESPHMYFDQIRDQARQQVEARIRAQDFIGAFDLADIAEYPPDAREEMLALARQYATGRLATATSPAEIQAIYRDSVALEERAGHFAEAGMIAADILGDLELASRLYEKANLFNRAIETAAMHGAGQAEPHVAQIRLAELHERGGNLASAAQLYESAAQYEKAFALYERIRQYDKAIKCYLNVSNPDPEVLMQLYASAGAFEQVVEILMRPGGFADLERALSVATAHKLHSQIRVIKEKMAALGMSNVQDLDQCFTIARDDVIGRYVPLIGIDFGTTNSVAAIFNTQSKRAEIILTARGDEFEPSFFGLDDQSRPIFGEAARLRSLTAPESVVSRVKRSLGKQKSFPIYGRRYSCEEIVASFLRQLRANAEAYLRAKVEAEFLALLSRRDLRFPAEMLRGFLARQTSGIQLNEIVLSVPAYFNDNQKRATRDAAEIAGLRVRRLLHEPTAAALAYSYQKSYAGTLAVIDLGGGTLDISIVEISEGVDDVRAVGGDPKLGGSDIDTIMLQHVIDNISSLWGITLSQKTHPSEIMRLRDACELLKINLSSTERSTMELVHFLNRPRYTCSMTRAELEDLAKPILDRLGHAITKTIKGYGAKLDSFILVGNATKMPAVGRLAAQLIAARQLKGFDAGTVVAMGAALQGAILHGAIKQIALLDLVPYSLGISAINAASKEERFVKLIEKNTHIPITKAETFTTKDDNQQNVHIKVYQGESTEPQKNYFLGDFILDGIPPAPGQTPQIEVVFDIGIDCILMVTATDKATGNQRSVRIERAVGLSPQEKQRLSTYFTQREQVYALEKELEQTRGEISALTLTCEQAIRAAERASEDFIKLFHEQIEVNPQHYRTSPEQVADIQDMFLQKDQFFHGIPQYNDQFVSACNNIRQAETRHLDYSDSAIASQIKQRIATLSHYTQVLRRTIASVEEQVAAPLRRWRQILESLEPATEQMGPLELARYHLAAGRAAQAQAILESLASSPEGLTSEGFQTLLRCYVSLGMREAYRDTHRRFGALFERIYPSFNQLNDYIMKVVSDSIFMIQGIDEHNALISGSGFCIDPHHIATNRHVVERMRQQSINVIGKRATYQVTHLELDPINDIAILQVSDDLTPLILGEHRFVEPGEQVLAVGFAAPRSSDHSENIYVSQGIINAIRKIDSSPERVIFIDTKARQGMSGGPLINDLGEVIGIVTLVQYEQIQHEQGVAMVENQPVALPAHLLEKYVRP
ncbi:Hsp70 family protein [Chloroflexales bacterium ZM16-3]|nr:Hsp70 family protein [Chloroflexales bacterium ZM16-3]